ncbi:hypothetical protein C1645_875298 [Glomus cerebriforme]|uniref:Uncharacterized protein n=1 Tax=Glomus cerebriforme TaxID=658196 RepID=A0A397T1F8_9GLOM|nr:hypothetical protein C1645_875298 [Glomus cerebriforme]
MTNFEIETTSESGETITSESSYNDINMNLFENDVTSTLIINLGQTVIENFKKCTQKITIENSEVMTIANQSIENQRNVFREFIEASIQSSNYLADFSIDILFFVECFRNRQFSNEEMVDLLKDLLEKSERNYRLTKELKNILSKGTMEEEINDPEIMNRLNTILEDENIGMKEKLTRIHNILKEYIDNIEESPHNIDSVQKSRIRATLNKILQTFKNHPIFGTFGSIAFLAGGALIDGVAIAIFASLYLTGSASVLFNDIIARRERDELVEKINHVCDGLNSIVTEIGKIEIFWSEQIERIRYLINNLVKFDNENASIKRYQIANQIERRWKGVEDGCKNYSRLMRDVLNRDRLVGI